MADAHFASRNNDLDENGHAISLLFEANVNRGLRESKCLTFFYRKDVNRQ